MVSRETIRTWLEEGWTFRIKKVGTNQYITRRKGNQERSLGKYDGVLWDLIKESQGKKNFFEKKGETERMITSIVREIRSFRKAKSCKYVKDGFCTFWVYDYKQGFFDIADSRLERGYYTMIKDKSHSPKWVFRAVPFYCKDCSAYKN